MNVLVVDDEKNIREIMIKVLKLENINCAGAENGLSAQRMLQEKSFDIVVSDLKMPGMSGQELLEWIGKEGLNIPVIMMSAFGQAEDAVRALKQGAFDYIVKPFAPEEMLHRIRTAYKSKMMELQLDEKLKDDSYITHSPGMLKLKERMLRVAPTPSMVLITGESGSGKEVSARFIHKNSQVSNGPFISINIGGIPENLLESELFGYEKGAFTGAEKRKIGLFETAAGGTLFLDEIGEMPSSLQVKLLRVFQDKTIRRLGGISDIPINARIISATNKNLEEEVKKQTFREDLFYRLNVARIELMPLRERKEDILAISISLLKKLNKKMGSNIRTISDQAIEWLESYDFPGNIRELENILERACIFSGGTEFVLKDLDLPGNFNRSVDKIERGTIQEMEVKMTKKALHKWEGNRTKAAKELGISRRTILNKIKEFNLE
ncbi:MAG: sigma-54-dependent Fis family transcriptional regulator [Spirochaetaceae bacterium 4572_59]|nr:MAG: sigma-54-dependent Fis family transcriptional regulator [Spirochaetaceae bacterium 4572_59]